MPIVKKVQARELLTSAVVLNLGDVQREAGRMVESARAEAESILTAARDEAARLTECAAGIGRAEGTVAGEAAGRAEGLAEGTAQGREEAIASMSERLKTIATGWNEALDGLVASRDAIREEARRDLLRLSLAIAERVLGRLPAHDPSLVETQVSGAIEMLTGSTSLRISLHPEDLPVIERHLPSVMKKIRGGAEADVSIETDPAIIRGGCMVRAGDGEIDARLDVQMSKIVSGLFPELLEAPPSEAAVSPVVPVVPEAPSVSNEDLADDADAVADAEDVRTDAAEDVPPSPESDLLDDWNVPGTPEDSGDDDGGPESSP